MCLCSVSSGMAASPTSQLADRSPDALLSTLSAAEREGRLRFLQCMRCAESAFLYCPSLTQLARLT